MRFRFVGIKPSNALRCQLRFSRAPNRYAKMSVFGVSLGSMFVVIVGRQLLGVLRQHCSATLELSSCLRTAAINLARALDVRPSPTYVAAAHEFVPEGLRFTVFLGSEMTFAETSLFPLAAAASLESELRQRVEELIPPEHRVLLNELSVRPCHNVLDVED